ncbi:hypothetical protein ADK52_34375, partial [Streptomyces sp. WM6372]
MILRAAHVHATERRWRGAGDEGADTAEAVQDDVAALAGLDLVGTGGTGDGLGGEALHGQAAVVGLVGGGE